MRPVLRILALLLAVLALPASLAAQHIALKTVPIPAGEQFLIMPARNLGMGSVYVSHDDDIGDPFRNPARSTLIGGLRVLALPTIYGEASNSVGGRSLPLAVLVPGKTVSAAVAFALQQVDNPNRFVWSGPVFEPAGSLIQDNSSSNVYVQASVGLKLNARTSVGASLYHADLGAVDAVNLLYGRSIAINQDGGMTEARVGLTHDFGGDRRLDAIVLKNNVDMTHDVLYQDWTFRAPPTPRTWRELNEDRTETWGAHLRYVRPLGEHGTRLGFISTVNTKSHPKIPNYNLVNIPRDPGNSTAFNFGVGLTSQEGPSVFSVELIYEPGRSHTWAYADTIITTPQEELRPGDKTIDNQFRFNSWNIGFGIEREGDKTGFQLGLRLRRYDYDLDQHNFLTDIRRQTHESWLEWSPSWSGVVKFPEFELRYTGRFTAKGWPNNRGCFLGCRDVALASPGGPDFVIGVTEPVVLPEFRVTTHRFTISVPFRL